MLHFFKRLFARKSSSCHRTTATIESFIPSRRLSRICTVHGIVRVVQLHDLMREDPQFILSQPNAGAAAHFEAIQMFKALGLLVTQDIIMALPKPWRNEV